MGEGRVREGVVMGEGRGSEACLSAPPPLSCPSLPVSAFPPETPPGSPSS